MANPKDLAELKTEFMKIDIDNSGLIEFRELDQALRNMHIKTEEIDSIIKELDYDGNQLINYSEFLAATIQVKKIITHERLEALFSQFDIEQRNQITAENIVETLKKMGREITTEEIKEIMQKHD